MVRIGLRDLVSIYLDMPRAWLLIVLATKKCSLRPVPLRKERLSPPPQKLFSPEESMYHVNHPSTTIASQNNLPCIASRAKDGVS
jgi:hypothetical protein